LVTEERKGAETAYQRLKSRWVPCAERRWGKEKRKCNSILRKGEIPGIGNVGSKTTPEKGDSKREKGERHTHLPASIPVFCSMKGEKRRKVKTISYRKGKGEKGDRRQGTKSPGRPIVREKGN